MSKENFVYRYRLRKEHLADLSAASDDYFAAKEGDIVQIEATLAMVGGRWCTATPRGNDATAHWLASRRQDGPAAYPAVAQGSPARINIPATGRRPNQRPRNGARHSQRWPLRPRLGTSPSALDIGELHRPRFDEVEHIMTTILGRTGHIRAADGSVVRLDIEMGAYVATYYRPNKSVRAMVRGSLAEVQTAMKRWTFAA